MKNSITPIVLLFFLLLNSESLCQRYLKLSVDVDGKKSSLSYINREENVYISTIELAKILSANYHYNQEAAKIEIKFNNYNIKFTARNQFIVLTNRNNNSQNTFQLPISTLLVNNDVFIPLLYCIDYLSDGSDYKLNFDNRAKHLKISKKETPLDLNVTNNETVITKPAIQPETKTESKGDSRFDIYEMSVEDKANGTLIRLRSNKKIAVPRSSINNNTLYVFFSNVTIAPELIRDIAPVGVIKRIKRTTVSSKNIQLEFLLGGDYSTSEIYQDALSNDLLITIRKKQPVNESATIENVKTKWLLDVVVIDAGHGGKDPGAIGITGVKEKDVNLSIALKLGGLIEKNIPGVKVIYTRKKDEFVELYKRGKIANEAGGKLFISIHCNSMPKKGTGHRGFEVYLLRPGRTKEAIDIAEFENSVIKFEDNPQRYQQLTDENFILVSMAHSQYMRYSEKFSDILNQDWKKNVSIPSLGIKQAGFYVLVGASMPSVLIEAGFLSNRTDEAFLASSNGQMEIARSIFNSVKNYKDYYDREIEN